MSVGLTRVFIDIDSTVDLRQPALAEVFGGFLSRWYKEGVEVIGVTKQSVDKSEQVLQEAELRRYFEEVRSLTEPKIFNSVGDMLYEGLKKHGWVPREQLYVDSSVDSMTTIWQEASGAKRRVCMAHTLRLSEELGVATASELLGIVSERVFMPPSKGTTHVYVVNFNGQTKLDEDDSLLKMEVDGLRGSDRAQRDTLSKMSAPQQEAALLGRPDLVRLLRGEQAAYAAMSNGNEVRSAPPPPQPVSSRPAPTSQRSEVTVTQQSMSPAQSTVTTAQAMSPMQTTATNVTKTTAGTSPAPKAKSDKPAPVRTVTLSEVQEGTRVQICTGPQEGSCGIVVKVVGVGSGGDVRYRVKIDDSESTTWTTKVRGVLDGAAAPAEQAAPAQHVVSPMFAAMSGLPSPTSPKGKGKGAPSPPSGPPTPVASSGGEEFPEGSIVEVLIGAQKGKCGTVIRITQEDKNNKRYQVEIEAGGGKKWVDKIKIATRALEKEEVKIKISDLYDIEKKKLGTGAFGSVQKVQNKATKLVRAMKTCLKPLVKDVEAIWKEVRIMKRLDHPNIIKLYDTFEDHRSVYLIMELCSGGELFNRILDVGRFGESDAVVVMQHIFRGVFYMHSKRITHRDLKPENFLLTESGTSVENSGVKIIDFGLSHDFPEEGQMLRTKAGSAYYVSPQVLNASYDHMADMWSLGVITYILLCGSPPFEGETDPEIFAKIKTGEFEFGAEDWGDISKDAKDLISGLLTFDPRSRITAQQSLQATWVSKLAPKALAGRKGSMLDNLRSFQNVNKFKKAALQVVATEMDDLKIKALRETFLAMDTNGDGLLSAQELRDGMSKLGLKEIPSDLGAVLAAIDCNSSGSIDYTEFISAGMDKKTYIQEDVCWAVFRVFDKDGNGKISKEEIAEVLRDRDILGVAAVDIAQIVSDIDTNGDGEIDFDEFMKMMRGGA